MSYPVFLESPPWPRMPEGRKGELPAYFESGGPSLEANATIPLLWQALFGLGDIRYAACIDDFDPERDAIELEEFYEDATPADLGATYPYLVTDRDSALARLDARRERLIGLVGERFRPIYLAFADHIRERYGDYILVRTSGLPDVQDTSGWITGMLEDMQAMGRMDAPVPPNLAEAAKELRRVQDADAVWRISGRGFHRDEALAWPSSSLIAAFPAFARCQLAPPQDAGTAVRPKPAYRSDTVLDKVLEWAAVILFAAVALVVWWKTRSIWLGLLAAIPVALIAGWALARFKRVR